LAESAKALYRKEVKNFFPSKLKKYFQMYLSEKKHIEEEK
jgi:hypothetical protein